MSRFRTLYIDMDSFFASIEQQLDSTLRNKPVAIAALENDFGCVVAASYEAKAYGVKTGTRVRDAKILCPGIHFRPSRHRLYSKFNKYISYLLDDIAELESIRSIDEFQIYLGRDYSSLSRALLLSTRIKSMIYEQVGEEISLSIGIAANPLLAKIASKINKPDGLQWLCEENMPSRIKNLYLEDLPGISKGIKRRLLGAKVYSVEDLYYMDPRHARLVWRSVEGERFVRSLRGENIPINKSNRGSYGNSKVLSPENRSPRNAYLVGRWLIEKSAERLRRYNYCASRLDIFLRLDNFGSCQDSVTFLYSQDTLFFLKQFKILWTRLSPVIESQRIKFVGVRLSGLINIQDRSGEFLTNLYPGEKNISERLSSSVDNLNLRYGKRIINFGIHREHPGFFERG
ncbi:MAG: DNA polymerase Y family protein [Alphaproteobacteria bacterium]